MVVGFIDRWMDYESVDGMKGLIRNDSWVYRWMVGL